MPSESERRHNQVRRAGVRDEIETVARRTLILVPGLAPLRLLLREYPVENRDPGPVLAVRRLGTGEEPEKREDGGVESPDHQSFHPAIATGKL